MAEKMTVYRPGDRLATMTPDGHTEVYEVDETGLPIWVEGAPRWRCPALLYHGPGHQSSARCKRKGVHGLEDEHYATNPMEPGFEWTGEVGYS